MKKEEIRKEAEAHWNYTRGLIDACDVDEEAIALACYCYIQAYIHAYKHAEERSE